MNILVTGSSGFVGRRLVNALHRKGHNVMCFDTGNGKDITKNEDIVAAMHGIEVVYHLAAVLDEKNAADLEEVNVQGTKNVLEAASKAKIEQFVFLSTVGVMGDIKGKVDETAAYKPKTPYEKSKAEAEKLVLSYQEALPVTIVRAALAYGNNKYWQGIVKLVRKGFPIIGSGKNKWQIIYVDDLVDVLVFLLGKEDALVETFIVAGESAPTLKQLYGEIAKQLGIKNNKVKTIPKFIAKIIAWFSKKNKLLTSEHIDRLVRNREYNTGKIKKLGWKAKYDFKAGISEMLKEMKREKLL